MKESIRLLHADLGGCSSVPKVPFEDGRTLRKPTERPILSRQATVATRALRSLCQLLILTLSTSILEA